MSSTILSSVVINGEKELALAAGKGDLTTVTFILSRKYVNDLGRPAWPHGSSPLHEAVLGGHETSSAVVDHLVRVAGVSVDCLGSEFGDMTALHLAVCWKGEDMVRTLLGLGADPEVRTTQRGCHFSMTAIELARREGREEVVKILEEYKTVQSKKAVQIVVSKVGSRRKLEEALAKSTGIHKGVDKDEKRLKEMRIAMERLTDSIKARKKCPDYLTSDKVAKIRLELEEIDEVSQAVESVSDKVIVEKSCPICLQRPQTIFNCVVCNKWFCGECKRREVIAARCPNCRADFRSNANPLRNIALERFMTL